MSTHLDVSDAAIRLLGALIAGTVLGLNRNEHGHAAGLRTSILLCLAACLAMLQVNQLLPLAGRESNSFVMNDLMRLPLGILSGIGFIGAGAIVRRDNVVTGVTTAATMWLLTVIGLCFGGGQIGLGLAGTGIGSGALIGLKALEKRLSVDRRARLVVASDGRGLDDSEVRSLLQSDGFRILSHSIVTSNEDEVRCEQTYEVRWRGMAEEAEIPPAVLRLADRRGISRVAWTPQSQ